MNIFNGKTSAVISPANILNLQQNLLFLDCRQFDDYEFCHLDGAIHIDIDSDLSSAAEPGHNAAKGGRNPLPKIESWKNKLRKWGISPDNQDGLIVAYDNASGAEGATRAWWMLTASGINAAVLDGGWDTAMRAHLPVSKDIPKPKPSTIELNDWSLPIVNMETVDKLRNNPDWILLDTRSPERWRGDVEPLDPIPGHIPGSKNVHFKKNLEDGLFKNPEELRKMYLQILGDIPPNRLIVSCGSGMTACHTLLALHQAGLEGASLYVGSYSEWCRNKVDG